MSPPTLNDHSPHRRRVVRAHRLRGFSTALMIAIASAAIQVSADVPKSKPRYRIDTPECLVGSSGLRMLNYLGFGEVTIKRVDRKAVSVSVKVPHWADEMKDPASVLLLRMAARQVVDGRPPDTSTLSLEPDGGNAAATEATTKVAVSALANMIIALDEKRFRDSTVLTSEYSSQYFAKCTIEASSNVR